MSIKPLLSHKRQNATSVARLRDTLKIFGSGGWKDTEDLRVGDRTAEGIRRAIFKETGGFIWWGTKRALSSRFINEVEIPTAFERKNVEPDYPVVPLFIDLDPGSEADRRAIRTAIGESGGCLLDSNGLRMRPGESAEEFRLRVSRRYVRDAVKSFANRSDGGGPITVAFRALSEPSGEHNLTFDWRDLINAKDRTLRPGAFERMQDALGSGRTALQAAFHSPEVVLDLDLPLPLAFMVGYEWRLTTRFRLVVTLRTGAKRRDVAGEGKVITPAAPVQETRPGRDAVVLVVSCREGLGDSAARYATEVDAREIITLHVPGILDSPSLRGLARACAQELRRLNTPGITKYLLILGPSALAVFAGAAANASGPVTIPFWDGERYVDGIVVGA